jgi:hypothetical protein
VGCLSFASWVEGGFPPVSLYKSTSKPNTL